MNFCYTYTTGANYKNTEKSFKDLRDYIQEKFNDINNKYDELKAALSNDMKSLKKIGKKKLVKLVTN